MHKNYTKEFLKNNKAVSILIFLVYIGNSLISIVVSWYLQVLMDSMSSGSDGLTFAQLLQIFSTILIAVLLLSITQYLTMPGFLERALVQYREKIFNDLLKKNILSFSKENTSTYISALTNDITMIEDNYLKNFFKIIQMVVMFVGALALMIFYSWQLTLISIVLMILPIGFSILQGDKLAQKQKEVSDANEEYVDTVKDVLTGFSVVKTFKAESSIETLINSKFSQLENKKKIANQTIEFLNAMGAMTQLIAQMGTLLIGYVLVTRGYGHLTSGMVLSFTNLLNFIIQPISLLPTLFAKRDSAIKLVEKIYNHLTLNANEDKNKQEAFIGKEIPISLENVSYSYDGENATLQDISHRFEPGKSYAIVGMSGSGKSTLLNLLLGVENNFTGTIHLDNLEIRSIKSSSLLNMIGHIQQSVFLFNATIEENVTMFQKYDEKLIEQVLSEAGLTDLIEQYGRDFLVGENGNHLSGGERQRISIARALLRRTPVLLIDEATSALDNMTATQIENTVLSLEGITRIMITHRLYKPVLERFDDIIVLKEGKIIEIGKFNQLMDKKGYFYSLFNVEN